MKRLLIANRGEIARRVIRTAHRLGIETVAVYSDADARALHVREATVAVPLHGDASADTYLRIDKLLAAARETGADAVHPGYGFLSENAEFAQAVVDAGLTWVGPPASAIRALGSKSRAKQLAQARGVPCLHGYQGEDQSDERFAAEARRIGFPVMVKAAAGGGGRGMRLVQEPAQLPSALQSARSEAQSAFGSGELLLERALLAPRHVEVQVFADSHGHCIHLGERDCSVQRRHQKIIEETPSPAVDAAMRERMGRCAVELAQSAGYVGAGTVEFLVEGGDFFLMEMNTRLQVEHPVTEAVTGLDLVEWQLRIARGEPLPLAQEQVAFNGHAIEVRLCAEDEQFIPHTGRVMRFREPGSVRFDHAIEAGLDVPPYYDSMLGKLVAHAPTRNQAIDRLAQALDRTVLLGLPNNRQFLAACLRHPVFREGRALIPFLVGHGDEIRAAIAREESRVLPQCAAAVVFPRGAASHLASPFVRPARLRHRDQLVDVRLSESQLAAGDAQAMRVADGRWHVQAGPVDLFVEDASFDPSRGAAGGAGSNELRAPFNGKVIAIKAEAGTRVAKGDTLLVIESMKLEHALSAARDGVVKAIHVKAGQQAATSQVLVSFEAAA
ncbi:acetyl/propionyl/methylcrotonyl-CoA carboxylase subunit alpha [Ramlibacter albus]|uniref:Biotin/lipoyl-binding protein n=1 Tax=Ramlibacter albus TaxID=2079448 RepID=A0A923S5F0_9BURK|nr:biotin carboxylase N-terminal domain-containing protein [Ramlibacter albus]MBC5768500.1 biotin/lipoyl-binding protein [Ramlibacter albus]